MNSFKIIFVFLSVILFSGLLSSTNQSFAAVDTWTIQSSPTSTQIIGVSFVDESNGWAVGNDGTIIYYDGTSWTTQSSPKDDPLFGVSFVDESNGWAVGGSDYPALLYYDGTSWTAQTTPLNKTPYAVSFVDQSNGWSVGNGGTIFYYDGTSWTTQSSPTSNNLLGVSFVDQSNGWAVGASGTIIYYDGTSWTTQSSPVSTDMIGVSFVDESNGWAVGRDGSIIYYDGNSWTAQSSPTSNTLRGLSFLDENYGWAVGNDGLVLLGNGIVTTPDAPTNLTATAGESQVSLTWTVPIYDGDSSITDYTIEYSDDNIIWVVFDDGVSTDTSVIVTSLTDDQQYSFRVSAVNSVGTGDPSNVVIATPGVTIQELQDEIGALTDIVVSLNNTVNEQQQDIDYLYEIWEDIRDTIISWLAGRP